MSVTFNYALGFCSEFFDKGSQVQQILGNNDLFHILSNVFVNHPNHWLQETHQYFTKASPARKGDYIEFIADMDLLVAMSTCPQGKNLKQMHYKSRT